jgi:ATP-dependent DNA helicase RecG
MVRVSWDSPLSTVTGKSTTNFAKATGFETVGDLLGHYPRHYVERGRLSDLGELTEGDYLSLVGQIVHSEPKTYQDRRTGRTAYRLEVRVKAEDGVLALTWFDKNKGTAEWRAREFHVGRVGLFSGRLKWFNGHWELNNPDSRMYVEDGDALDRMPALIPIYKAAGRVNSWQIEETVGFALDLLDEIPEQLPESVRAAEGLIGFEQALRWVHRPDDHQQLGAARKRLRYDEAFVTQTVLARRRAALRDFPATPRPGSDGGILEAFDARLPFTLTAGQQSVGAEIATELAEAHPMHRLLQGEVGSGKTLVALRAMLQVVDSGGQAALLAPTEVLAQQHLRSIQVMLGDLAHGGQLGGADQATRVTLLTGSMSTAARRQAMLDAASGEAGIVIGTHALLEEKVQFFDLGLVVVDEQHRFGVEQRAALTSKAGTPPHVLVMTATPIPRTVAMTVFGDLDTSTLSELPAGRGEVQSTVVPIRAQPAWLERAWQRIREEVDRGRQAYVVCSRIGDTEPEEGSEAADAPDLFSVEELAPELASGALHGLRVEMLHGRMTPDDKDRVMQAFAAGKIDVLVSTTVIEVGVDVANATAMVILDADRFGVSQLHQLRGRVGRGGLPGLCLLVTHAELGSPARDRLEAVAGTTDGFALSQVDLELRREGDILGASQSGRYSSLQNLRVLRDEKTIVEARTAATTLLDADPDLAGAPELARMVGEIERTEGAQFLERS